MTDLVRKSRPKTSRQPLSLHGHDDAAAKLTEGAASQATENGHIPIQVNALGALIVIISRSLIIIF